MINFFLNAEPVSVEKGFTIMQACELLGIEIPHFCYHPKLDISGNCRMCLVEIEGANKLVASCAMTLTENMRIHTNTAKVRKARESVMEFLLINHPLDCPICDQGGECDLQDQAFKYGKGISRYSEIKRSVPNKDLGPFVKTNMNRCIHCSRCVRFLEDVAGSPELGMIFRGENSEITNYQGKALNSELSGNIIDLCPVGALTSKPYQFTYRSWELKKTESIDVLDAMGCNIRIDSKGLEIVRILPKTNDEINEEWISDKARFSYDALKIQRLDKPYIRENSKLIPVNWEHVLKIIVSKMSKLKKSEIASLAGFFTSSESMFLMKKLMNCLHSNLYDANQKGFYFDVSSRGNYLFNTGIENIEKADLCLLIGTDIKKTAPVLNTRIRKGIRENNLKIANLGEQNNQDYPVIELGNNPETLRDILNEKNDFHKIMQASQKVMIIVGDAVFSRKDCSSIMILLHKMIKKFDIINSQWNGFNILHKYASSVAALDLGFYCKGTEHILKLASSNKLKMLYLLGADDFDISKISKDVCVIYQGSHLDRGASIADIILPSAAYTEEDAIFVNTEGRPQFAYRAVHPPKQALPNWQILSKIISCFNKKYQFKNLDDIRKSLYVEFEIFSKIGKKSDSEFKFLETSEERLDPTGLKTTNDLYYMSDHLTRASANMARAVQYLKNF
ncbi:MAG: NADH-quinone oxidoreductase subunit G [Rickettsia sp.]|nr:NADH-quinone oxidoreductase subunit G [Rickettsia sp.]